MLFCLHGAVSDLHAAGARYHEKCRKQFYVQQINESRSKASDEAFKQVLSLIIAQREIIPMWTSVDIFDKYSEFGGTKLDRRRLLQKLIVKLDNQVVTFSSHGLASIVMFRNKASDFLRLIEIGMGLMFQLSIVFIR